MRTNWILMRSLILWSGALGVFATLGCSDDSLTTSDAGSTSGTGGTGGGAGGSTSSGPTCGDAVVELTEECDDGNLTSGDGCDNDCSFTCTDTGDCDDMDACSGTESCGADHVCAGTAPLPDGTACLTGSVCIGGNCTAGSCGDAQTTGTEDCDDGNATPGDGCDNDCTFSCLSTNPAKNCASTDPCVSDGTCDDSAHTCTAGTPLGDGLTCGVAQICVNGACTLEQCGDGFVATGEDCDFGAGNGVGTGCELGCIFSCLTTAACDDAEPCNGSETCASMTGPNGGTGQTCTPGTALAPNAPCGSGMFCINGTCTTVNCGNGIIEGSEQCDLGGGNGPGTGCEANCQFSCTTSPDSCVDANPCNGTEVCTQAVVTGQTVQLCQAGTNAAQCTACTGGVCNAVGACAASTCGDGCVNGGAGEQCEPPNTAACSATCTLNPVCGNGTIEGAEHCDDGNLAKLDGCDSACKYEMVTRMTSVVIQGTAAPAGCTPTTNRLGTQSLTGLALNQLNTPLQAGIDAGTTNILTQFIGLDDLTGVADPSGLSVGVLAATLDPAKGAWPGNNPIDWWYLAEAASLDGNDLPTGLLTNGTLAARQLGAGPNTVTVTLLLGGTPAALQMRSSRIAATLNGTPAPNVPAPPPSTLAAGLTVFQTLTADGTGQGLCGNITVESLSKIPVPETLAQGGGTPCGACSNSRQYTYCGAGMPVGAGCNSLLDVLVGGCKVVACFVTAVNPQQPDVAGTDSDIDTLTLGAGNKVPNGQVTGNDDAYSSYLKFSANRAHITGKQ